MNKGVADCELCMCQPLENCKSHCVI